MPTELSSEELEADAALDVELVYLIRDVMLPAMSAIESRPDKDVNGQVSLSVRGGSSCIYVGMRM